MKLKEIYEYLNELCPFDTQCQWDNSGFLIGDFASEIEKVGISLDLTLKTLEKAKGEKVDLIITHHPVIFKAVKSLKKGDIAYEAAVSGIPVIACHTCYDGAKGGVNDILAERLGIKDTVSFGSFDTPDMARGGKIEKISPLELAKKVAKELDTTVRLADGGKNIESLAVCGGSGGDILDCAIEMGFDAYVSGDISHHQFLLAEEKGITVIAAGHFETENISMEVLKRRLSERFADVIFTELSQKNPVQFIS